MERATRSDIGFSLADSSILALIRKIESGDKAALAILYDKTSPLLFGLTLRILGDGARAEETLLDIYTHVWKEASAYDSSYWPLEWLIMVARTRAIARLHWDKRGKRERRLPADETVSLMTVAPEQQKLARSSFESLVPLQREILDWAYCSGLSCSEIAAQIGKPVGAVKTHARLGLSKLSEKLGAQERTESAATKTHAEP